MQMVNERESLVYGAMSKLKLNQLTELEQTGRTVGKRNTDSTLEQQQK